ncbi:MAG: hypothetical protein U0V75_03235 [Ferruginibacter sp.]
MKYIIPCLFLVIVLSQCTKDNPGTPDPAVKNIFSVTPDPGFLLDTLTVSTRTTKEINYGYFFSYDNQNRVSEIKCYQYFFNTPVNLEGTWKFNYQGNGTNPQSMDQLSYYNYRVYFYYNANGSKNRDSIANAADTTLRAVRKYVYDSAFNFAVVKVYSKGSLRPTLQDSATFKNYNCTAIYSKQMTWFGNTPYTYEWFDNHYPQVDNNPNPLSKMNIFPALFLAPYLKPGYNIHSSMWEGNILMDFAFQNNPVRFRFYDYATGGYNYAHVSSGEGVTYDPQKRIIRQDYADSAGTTYNFRYTDRFYTTYKYR